LRISSTNPFFFKDNPMPDTINTRDEPAKPVTPEQQSLDINKCTLEQTKA
jgi:hypothetical protein